MIPFSDAMIIKGKLRLIFSDTEFSEYRLEKPKADEYIGRFGHFHIEQGVIFLYFLNGEHKFKLKG